jgi:hypothetical protein
MTTFPQLNRVLMDIQTDKIEPMRRAGPIGCNWTARLADAAAADG